MQYAQKMTKKNVFSPEEKLKMLKPKAVDSKQTRWPRHDLKLITNNADVKAIVIKMMARMSPLMPFDAYCKKRWGHLFR